MKQFYTLAHNGTDELDQLALRDAGYRCAGASTPPIQGSGLTTACARAAKRSGAGEAHRYNTI